VNVIQKLALAALVGSLACDAVEQAQQRAVQDEMSKIEKQVAADAVKQYEIAKRGSDKMQTCVQAGFVKAAFLQAKDEANYKKWTTVEKADCAAAGLPAPE
jgi:hypothetical protein